MPMPDNYLQTVQNHLNDRLQICGCVSIKEVLEKLGFDCSFFNPYDSDYVWPKDEFVIQRRSLLGELVMHNGVRSVYVSDLVVRRSGGSQDHLVGAMSQVIGLCDDGLLVLAPVVDWTPFVDCMYVDAPQYYELLID